MAVLVDENTKVICQGLTGSQEMFVNFRNGAEKIVAAVKG